MDVVVCYGSEDYNKFMGKNCPDVDTSANSLCEFSGTAQLVEGTSHEAFCVVGISDMVPSSLDLQVTLLHELSHVVSDVMIYSGIECDEFRSYTLGNLYEYFIPLLEDITVKDFS